MIKLVKSFDEWLISNFTETWETKNIFNPKIYFERRKQVSELLDKGRTKKDEGPLQAMLSDDNDQLLLPMLHACICFYILDLRFSVLFRTVLKEKSIFFFGLIFVSPNYRCMHVQNDFFLKEILVLKNYLISRFYI